MTIFGLINFFKFCLFIEESPKEVKTSPKFELKTNNETKKTEEFKITVPPVREPTPIMQATTISSIVNEINTEATKSAIGSDKAHNENQGHISNLEQTVTNAVKKIKTEKQPKDKTIQQNRAKQSKKQNKAETVKNCENNQDYMMKLQQQQQLQQQAANILNAQVKAEKLYTHEAMSSGTPSITTQQQQQIKYAAVAAAAAAAAASGNAQSNYQFQQIAANFPCIPILNHLMYAQKMSIAAAAAKQHHNQFNNNQHLNNKQIFNETQNFYNFTHNYPLAASTPTPSNEGGNNFVNHLNFAATIAAAAASKAAAYNQQYSNTNGIDLSTPALRTTTPDFFSNPNSLDFYNNYHHYNQQQHQQQNQAANKLNDISSLKETQMRIMESCNLVND